MEREDFNIRVLEGDEFSEAIDCVLGGGIITRVDETVLCRQRSGYDDAALGLNQLGYRKATKDDNSAI